MKDWRKRMTASQMVERYLHTIEFWLPRKQRRDLLAEISEDLHSQIEERESELGRQLNETEMEALLKQRGRPLVVANGYRPQQSLIGPLWFPTYLTVMKVVAFAYVPLWLAVYVVVKRAENPGEGWGATLLATWGMLWTVGFFAASTVTFVFALVQFIDSRTHFMQDWKVSDLPPVNDPFRIKRSSSIAEILANGTFVVWWIAFMSSLPILSGPTWTITVLPVWNYFVWGFSILGLFNIGLAIANLRQPYWSRLRASCRLASDLAGGVLFCRLLRTTVVRSFSVLSFDADHMAALSGAIHLIKERSFLFAVVVVAIFLAVDGYRLIRVSRAGDGRLVRKALA